MGLPSPTRLVSGLVVCALHLGAVWTLERATLHRRASSRVDERIVVVFSQPTIRDSGGPITFDLSRRLVLTRIQLTALSLDSPQIDFEVDRNPGSVISAPVLQTEGPTDIGPYIKKASLLPGEGATVVLRVEVLATGGPGRILVEATSGSWQIDQAAVDYARTRRWYAGRANGEARTMWIRWGLHLQS
jgi:hypothetical protein